MPARKGKPRHHKASGLAFIELDGRRFYLGKYGSKARKQEYDRLLAEYLANGRKLVPTRTKSETSCYELAIHFLEWAEEYFMRQPTSFAHIRKAMEFLVKHYGQEPGNNFTTVPRFLAEKTGRTWLCSSYGESLCGHHQKGFQAWREIWVGGTRYQLCLAGGGQSKNDSLSRSMGEKRAISWLMG